MIYKWIWGLYSDEPIWFIRIMAVLQPPPTYADVVLIDERTQKGKFNPIWLKWFLDLIAVLNASGGGGGVLQHNLLSGLQGGQLTQYYHLTSTEHTGVLAHGINPTEIHVFGAADDTPLSF